MNHSSSSQGMALLAPAAPGRSWNWWIAMWPQVAGFAALFLVWHVAAVHVVQSLLFPGPVPVFIKGWELASSGMLFAAMGISLQRILIGFFLGAALGVPLGLIIGTFPMMRRFLEPWTEFLRFIPSVAMITIAVIWFGIGEESKVFLIIYTTIFIVILNTAAGVQAISRNKVYAAQVLGASRAQIFFLVSLPGTVPYILTGMRIAMANSFTTIVAAEMISADQGLGVMLWNGRMFMLVDEIFVSLVCLGLLGLIVDKLFRWGIRNFCGRFGAI
jgi:ABC-type nitrate/sulfonate/bicarbonate transport system permease component